MTKSTEVREYLENLAPQVQAARSARGLTLRAAADEAEVSLSWLWKIERGDGNPGLAVVLRIVRWLEQQER